MSWNNLLLWFRGYWEKVAFQAGSGLLGEGVYVLLFEILKNGHKIFPHLQFIGEGLFGQFGRLWIWLGYWRVFEIRKQKYYITMKGKNVSCQETIIYKHVQPVNMHEFSWYKELWKTYIMKRFPCRSTKCWFFKEKEHHVRTELCRSLS